MASLPALAESSPLTAAGASHGCRPRLWWSREFAGACAVSGRSHCGVSSAAGAEPQQRDIEHVRLRCPVQFRRDYFGDDHLGQELHLCTEKMTGVTGRRIFLEPDSHMDVWFDLACLGVNGQGAAAERFHIA